MVMKMPEYSPLFSAVVSAALQGVARSTQRSVSNIGPHREGGRDGGERESVCVRAHASAVARGH